MCPFLQVHAIEKYFGKRFFIFSFIFFVPLVITSCDNDTNNASTTKATSITSSDVQASEQKNIQDTDDFVHKCDDYAAHPDDPSKWAKGVQEEDLIPGPAIKFCTDAVSQFPNSARFQFQLGRALLKSQKYDTAAEALAVAAEQNYGPAYAYLADLYRYGVLGEEDLETAEAYYDLAIANGFGPAIEAKAGMFATEDDDHDIVEAESAAYSEEYYETPAKPRANDKNFNPGGFAKGDILKAIHDGEFGLLKNQDQFRLTIYLENFNNGFSETYNMMDESCSAAASHTMVNALKRKRLDAMGIGLDQPSEQIGLNALNWYGNMLTKTMGQGGVQYLANWGMTNEETGRAGVKDSVIFAKRYGCGGEVFQKLYSNFEAYVNGQSPKYLSGVLGLNARCQKYARSKGSSTKDANTVCNCFSTKFSKKVSEQDIEWLAQNYDQSKNFNRIVKKYNGLNKDVASCLL